MKQQLKKDINLLQDRLKQLKNGQKQITKMKNRPKKIAKRN